MVAEHRATRATVPKGRLSNSWSIADLTPNASHYRDAAGGSYLGDLTLHILDATRVVEVKARAKGFCQLYGWLENRDILVVRADRKEPLVVLPLKLAAEIAAKAAT